MKKAILQMSLNPKTQVYNNQEVANTYKEININILFVPVCNHGLVMGPFEAALFAKQTGASITVPIHYNNPSYPVDMNKLKEEFEKHGINYKIMELEESIEI